jgi:hypothetical protein
MRWVCTDQTTSDGMEAGAAGAAGALSGAKPAALQSASHKLGAPACAAGSQRNPTT